MTLKDTFNIEPKDTIPKKEFEEFCRKALKIPGCTA